jgi:hypothetical protein
MPRKKGAVNYKNKVLINIVEEILPNGDLGWEAVAIAYQGNQMKRRRETPPIEEASNEKFM